MGFRWQVTISPDGIRLKRWFAWIVPQKNLHFLLDTNIQTYDTLESITAEGIEIADFDFWNAPDVCFGPSGKSPDFHALLQAMQTALENTRAYVEQAENHASPRLRHPVLQDPLAFDPRTATWHRPFSNRPLHTNRVHEIHSLRDVTVAKIHIPAHSLFTFNTRLSTDPNTWIDPRRPDVLARITVSATTTVPHLGEISANSILVFAGIDTLFLLHEAGGRNFHAHGFTLDGNHFINFRNGHPAEFRLAEPRTVAGYYLPAQTLIEQTIGMSEAWRCTLVEPVQLPQFTLAPGDALHFHASLKYPLYASSRHALQIGNKHIEPNTLIFLKRNGRIKHIP